MQIKVVMYNKPAEWVVCDRLWEQNRCLFVCLFMLCDKEPFFVYIDQLLCQCIFICSNVHSRRATREGICPSPEIFKTFHSIWRNFQRIKMKFYILIIFKKSYCNISLSCSLIIISLQDLSSDRLSDQKFRKWLVFNHKYAESVNLGYILYCSYFMAFFCLFFYIGYYCVLDRPQFALMKLYNIRVLLNRAGCWNFQIDKRNLDIAVSASSHLLFFYEFLIYFVRGKADIVHILFFYILFIIIFVRDKRITIIDVVHLKKSVV